MGVIVGVLLLAAGAGQASSNSSSVRKVVVTGTVNTKDVSPGDAKDVACARNEDRRTSDLCAQWKAADAARDAADQAVIATAKADEANTISRAVAIFSFVAMVGALGSAWYSRRTLIAERAWMTVVDLQNLSDTENSEFPVPDEGIRFAPLWRNAGRSPALDFMEYSKVEIKSPADEVPLFKHQVPEGMTVVGANCDSQGEAFWVTADQLDQLKDGTIVLYLYQWCQYKTIFGRKASTESCMRARSEATPKPGNPNNRTIIFSHHGPQNNVS